MNYPSCENHLVHLIIAEIQFYVCDLGCRSLWFNRIVIKKLSELPDNVGQGLLITRCAQDVRSFRDVEHICPQFETTLLFRYFFSKAHDLEVDQCSKCDGLWIDFGRKNIFRKYSGSRDKFFLQKWRKFESILKEKFNQMENIYPDILEFREQIKHVFRFISPSES